MDLDLSLIVLQDHFLFGVIFNSLCQCLIVEYFHRDMFDCSFGFVLIFFLFSLSLSVILSFEASEYFYL